MNYGAMTTSRTIADAFYRAATERDLATIAGLLADNVDWMVQGPVDVFPFLGQRRGREAVLDGYKAMGQAMTVIGYDLEALLVDGDRSAALIRITARLHVSDRVVSCRTSQFMRFKDGRIVEMRGLIDTFDMVEQTLGRSLEVPLAPA
jgi:ketosteroid isomerase-like protein